MKSKLLTAASHKVVRISTRHGLGYCSICGKPALGFNENGRYVMRHVSEAEQKERAKSAGADSLSPAVMACHTLLERYGFKFWHIGNSAKRGAFYLFRREARPGDPQIIEVFANGGWDYTGKGGVTQGADVEDLRVWLRMLVPQGN